jgi:hypothetical protein
MKMAVVVQHHDPEYVERKVGWPLYTHLRGAGPRSASRAEAIERAWGSYRRAAARGSPGSELGGLGLIVLQRALLAAEDLASP